MNIVEDLPRYAFEGELVALDIEMYGMDKNRLHRPHGTFACISIALQYDSEEYNDQDPATVYQFYDPRDLREALERLKAGRWVFQNAVFDLRQMRRWVDIPQRPIWDTMLVDQELWGGYYSTFDLGSLSIRWLEQYMEKDTREEFGKVPQSVMEEYEYEVEETPIEWDGGQEVIPGRPKRMVKGYRMVTKYVDGMSPEMKAYAAKDALTTLRVAQAQMEYIEETDEPFDFYWEADAPMIWVVLDMPGAKIDVAGWQQMAQGFRSKADAIKASLDFNPGSWQQVQKKLQAETGYKLPSTDADHLEELRTKMADHHRTRGLDLVDKVLEYRHFDKAAGTYGLNWLDSFLEEGDLVYANWKICGATDTSRMSATDPALQTIPARKIPEFRNRFIASDDHIIVGADVAQQEVRILAWFSQDKHMISDLQAGISPHITTGKMIFNDPNFSKADKLRYTTAKEINLGIPYGMSAAGIATKAGITEEEAERHLETYFKSFPSVKLYMSKYRRDAQRHEFVRNSLGRRCWMNLHNYGWKNNAINAPIQSTAAHQTKIAGAYIHRTCREMGIPFPLTMFIHDEFVMDCPVELKDTYYQMSIDAWTEAGRKTLGDTIPVVAEPFVGSNWGEKK